MQSLDALTPQADATIGQAFDEDGFLLDHNVWTEELGRAIAEEEAVGPMTEEHWRVIAHVRNKFLTLGALPNLRLVCRATNLSKADIYTLFGGCMVIWRIAGLPNPGEEAKAYAI
jgi:tRNA 2-thiouridine synthesizing protein E